MNLFKTLVMFVGLTLCIGLAAVRFAESHSDVPHPKSGTRDREHIVFSKELPALDGAHLKATLVEVNYGPGEASRPHSHPCAVIGYVAEGTLRTQVKGEPEMTYKAGESFYEAPNGVHLVSANASPSKPAKLIAYLLCDHDTPLSMGVPNNESSEGIHQHGVTK